jgi:hypothetical protein
MGDECSRRVCQIRFCSRAGRLRPSLFGIVGLKIERSVVPFPLPPHPPRTRFPRRACSIQAAPSPYIVRMVCSFLAPLLPVHPEPPRSQYSQAIPLTTSPHPLYSQDGVLDSGSLVRRAASYGATRALVSCGRVLVSASIGRMLCFWDTRRSSFETQLTLSTGSQVRKGVVHWDRGMRAGFGVCIAAGCSCPPLWEGCSVTWDTRRSSFEIQLTLSTGSQVCAWCAGGGGGG